MSELALQLIRENKRTRDPFLDLGNCGLKNYLPKELLDCVWLKKISLGSYYRIDVSRKQEESKNTKEENFFSGDEFIMLKNLPLIKSLDLNNNRIFNINSLQNLNQLQYLSLSNNQISNIDSLQNLRQLQTLYLTDNNISNINSLQNLSCLQTLYLNSNKISDISSFQNLSQLKLLNLSSNKISNISYLQNLHKLEYLAISQNEISDISSLQTLHQLQLLDFYNNQIETLPIELIIELPKLRTLYISPNPIKNIPPEIVGKTYQNVLEVVKDHFLSIQKAEDVFPLYEAKLILVGRGSVGKSELVEALTDENYEFDEGRKQTEGISIKDWHPKGFKKDNKNIDFKVNIWDFGGQEIYYGTHQFFLSKNAVYLLVWDARQEEDTRTFDYWLRAINLLSEGSPVIIVHNKADLFIKELNQDDIKKNFPFVVDFFKTSCKTPDAFDNQRLKQQITRELMALSHIGEPWNKHRVAVRRTLEQDDRNYMSQEEYLNICSANGLKEEEPFFLSTRLHHLGVILHFQNDDLLKYTVILKPEWATSAFYKIINDKRIKDELKGSFSKEDLLKVWGETQYCTMMAELIQLMKRFELCFQYENQDRYIIPEISSSNPKFEIPSFTLYDSILEFVYQYEFMPKSILTRFICRNHKFISQERFWMSGVVLEIEGCEALLESSEINKRISIKVGGKAASKVLFYIRKDLDFIHDTVKNPKYDELVPCKSEICKHNEKPYYFKYQTLIRFQKKGDKDIRCEICEEKVLIDELIEGLKPIEIAREYIEALELSAKPPISKIIPAKPINKMDLKIIKIFIASSFELKADRDEFRTFISVENDRLVDKGIYLKIMQWEYMFEAISETRKQDDYNKHLKDCDLQVCLFGTKVGKYTNEEFDVAYQQFKAIGKPKIFTYFKKMHIAYDEINEDNLRSYLDFKSYLKSIEHFPSEYTDMADLKNKFKRNLEEYLGL